MKVHIVFESFFGNTEQVAGAIAQGLRSRGADVVLTHPGTAAAEDVDLLVIGSPTHNMGLPSPGTRRTAVDQGGHADQEGLLDWLARLPARPFQAALFSTVVDTRFHGSATRPLAKRLKKAAVQVVASQDFRVAGTKGPLVDGELDRARQWGESLL